MQVEFTKSWRNYHRGQVLDLADGVANVLLNRGICKRVDQSRPAVPAGRPEKTHQGRSRGRETRDG